MADTPGFVYADELYPHELFKILSAAVSVYRGKLLDKIEILLPQESLFTPLAALKIPNPYEKGVSMPQEYLKVFDALRGAYGALKNGAAPGGRAPAGETVPLTEGLCRLLLQSQPSPGSPGPPENDEFLVIARNIRREDASVLFKKLSLHSTFTRVSGVNTPSGGRYLFYLKDDHRRHSSFLSLAAGEGLMGGVVLQAFRADPFTLFLPPETNPGAAEVALFCQLIQKGPFLWGLGDVTPQKGLLGAICQWQKPQSLEFLFLNRLKFYDQTAFTKPGPKTAHFSILDMGEGQKSMEQLKKDLRQAAPEIGYRLELRPTRHMEVSKAERLYEEKARIEYRLAYLESISRPRPVLYRFTQEQLPALADVIRGFPLKVLQDGSLKYGFHAGPHNPAGWHFLLAEPGEAVMTALDPLPLWKEPGAPAIRFRLDPSWVRYYHDQSGSALVFVPEGTVLSPPMHDWDRGSMDRYLRETVHYWFGDDQGVTEVPKNPIFVFDGQPEPEAHIHIAILDLDRLEPLHTRLGWLNDNLTVMHKAKVENLVSRMAKDITWQEIYKQVMKDADTLQKDFENTAASAGQRMAETMQDMVDTLTMEINRMVEKTYRMTADVDKLSKELQQWENATEGIHVMLQEVKDKQERVVRDTVDQDNQFRNMARQVDYQLDAAAQLRQEIESKFEAELQKLRASYKKMKEKLLSFKV